MLAFVKPCIKPIDNHHGGVCQVAPEMKKYIGCIIDVRKENKFQYRGTPMNWWWMNEWLVILNTPELIEEYSKIAKKIYK